MEKVRQKEAARMTSICDRNCFECPYPDCINDALTMEDYQAEKEIDLLSGARVLKTPKKIAAQQKRYREANKEKVAAQQKQWYEANKEKVAAQQKQWYEANKEKVAARQKRYREANKEKVAAQKKQWYEANKEKIAAQQKRYREANKQRKKNANGKNRKIK